MKTLLFFTANYPFGKGETFIENEISFLASAFDKIYLFPAGDIGDKRLTPENCEIITGLFSDKGYNRNQVLLKFPYQVMEMFYSELQNHGKQIDSKTKLFSKCMHMAYKALLIGDWLTSNGIERGVFYTYWMDDWTTILSVLKSKGIIKNIITRAHGFDLYEYRQKNNSIPFRPYQLKQIDKVFLIAKEGLEYLKSEYPRYIDKMKLSYLGTSDIGCNTIGTNNTIHLLSISNIIPVKRVHLIVEILKNVKKKIYWTHFGDGIQLEEIIELSKSLPENVTVDFKGRVPNSEVLMFLKESPISFFINVSSSEGLPVSIMEAISFGIPVIATDVGGTAEIVNDKTGVLIESNFDPENTAMILNNFFSSKYATPVFRNGVREFWEDNFNAERNYRSFIKEIIK